MEVSNNMLAFTTLFDYHNVDGQVIINMKENKYFIHLQTVAILITKIRKRLNILNFQNLPFLRSCWTGNEWGYLEWSICCTKTEFIAGRFNELSPQWIRKTDNSIVWEWFAGRLAEPWRAILHGPVCKTTDHGRLPRLRLAIIYHDRAAASEVVT